MILKTILLFVGFSLASGFVYKPCALRKYPDGFVCVCNTTYCDNIPDLKLENRDDIILVSTSAGGLFFNVTRGKFEPTSNGTIKNASFVIKDPFPETYSQETMNPITDTFVMLRKHTFQRMIGFGAALTGTVRHILSGLPDILRQNIFESLYSHKYGIGLNMMRIPIGGSDFDLQPWSYAEYPVNDSTLSNFTTLYASDLKAIKYIKELEQVSGNYDIMYLGTAWSPPPWMKNNDAWSGRNHLLPQYYQTWADYHFRWLTLMKEQNISFWGITTGNEPTNSLIAWRLIKILDLGWTAMHQGKWVGEHLGPKLRNSEFEKLKIIAVDDESYVLPWWIERMNMGNKNASKYVDGVGIHWYLDTVVPATYLVAMHNEYPDKLIITSESCIGGKPALGMWARAERYMIEYHKDFVHWCQGWIHWNMLLNVEGGPSYQNHSNEAMLIVNTTSNAEFYKQPIFYSVGHYTKFVTPDSIRVHVYYKNFYLIAIVFDRPDGSSVLIVTNLSYQIAQIKLVDGEREVHFEFPPKSTHTAWYYKSDM